MNYASLLLAFFVIFLLQFGVLLSLVLLLICSNLMFTDLASEIYQTSKNFLKAVHDGAGLGVGDLEVVQRLKRSMPRLSNYYLVLSILFLTFAVTLGYIWSSLFWLFFLPFGPIFDTSKSAGVMGWEVAVLLYATLVFIILILSWKIRNKVLSYVMGPSIVENWEMQHTIK